MPAPVTTSKRRRIWRSCFCGVRIGILLVILFFIAIGGYLNVIGLPDFLKTRLVTALHARGVDLQFSRLRWRWYRGIVADNVHFGSTQPEANVPQVSFHEVEVRFDHAALKKFSFKVDSLLLHGGQVVWQLGETNQTPVSLSISNIQTQLRLLTNDQWQLDNFSAGFAGAKVRLSGSLTNASAIRDWNFIHAHKTGQPVDLRERLRKLAATIDQIEFQHPPQLTVEVNGDARDTKTLNGIVTLIAPDARTPWGILTNGTLKLTLTPPEATNTQSIVEFSLLADQVKSQWGSVGNFHLNLHAAGDDALTNLIRARLELTANHVNTPWAQAASVHFGARWSHSITNPIPVSGIGELRLSDAQTRWGAVDELRLNATLAPQATNIAPRADASWAWWGMLEPYTLDWNARASNLHAEGFKSQEVICSGTWRAPELTLTNLHTEMYGGKFDASANLNVVSRVLNFNCVSDFDVLQAMPFLTPGGRRWFEQQEFEWTRPPLAHAVGSATLPEWTNTHPNWTNIQSSLFLKGDFSVGAAAYHHVPVLSGSSHFTYSNMVWNLPDLTATRPEGKVVIEHISDDKVKDYYFKILSTVDIKALRHLLNPAGQKAADDFVFEQPPLVNAELWGRWHDYSHLGARAELTVTNFGYRGQTAAFFHGYINYTNQFLVLTNARVERSNQLMTAESIGFDFVGRKAFLTNGFSTFEPYAVVHSIGPKITRDMEPYKFLRPPTARAYGVIPLSDDISAADLHFALEGGPFEWMNFHVPTISGQVDWVGQGMTLKDIKADFYGGQLTGSAVFDFKPRDGCNFRFDTLYTDVSLGLLMSAVGEGTNHLEGILNGRLTITNAYSMDRNSWFGSGRAQLHDGLIWEIPIFGVLSPLLNGIVEGWGKTRISDATSTFIITNSVIRSDDLQLRSPTLRLFYHGTVDFDMKVDAKVEAEVGRDTPLVGPLVNLMLSPFSKMFETRVTGTLKNPKSAPATWVGTLFNPFMHPFRTLKEMLPGESQPPVYPTDPATTPPEKKSP